jgi:hypothetical protein
MTDIVALALAALAVGAFLSHVIDYVLRGFARLVLFIYNMSTRRKPPRQYGPVENADTTPPRHPDLDEPPMGTSEFRDFARKEKS